MKNYGVSTIVDSGFNQLQNFNLFLFRVSHQFLAFEIIIAYFIGSILGKPTDFLLL
jgi:hypothetical protein